MDWRKEYADKIVSAQEAISHVRSGDIIGATMFSSLPYALLDELGAQKGRLENVRMYLGFGGQLYRPLAKACNGSIRVNSMFFGPVERNFRYKFGSHVDFQPIQLSQIFIDRYCYHKADVIMMAAAPPDENGMLSFGATPMDTALCEAAREVIVQINENVPFIYGKDNMIHIKDVSCIVDKTDKICVLEPDEPRESELKIAEHIAPFILDGSCIQFGIGGLATAMGRACRDKRHLGIHTELFVDSMMDLIECGAVDNSRKQIDIGLSTFGFAMGSERLHSFLNYNKSCQSRRFCYSNDPYVIAQNDNVISVNSAMQIDLTGQVASEGVGFRQHSGTGGQLDYVRGAQMSKDGHSFIALDATRKDKAGNLISKIVLAHPEGTPITTPRTEVEYIVTEFGIANLRFASLEERAKSLINIAHPDFRDELSFQAKKVGLIV